MGSRCESGAVQRDVKRFVVMEFQEDHGLKIDGVCDMATWEAIDLAVLER